MHLIYLPALPALPCLVGLLADDGNEVDIERRRNLKSSRDTFFVYLFALRLSAVSPLMSIKIPPFTQPFPVRLSQIAVQNCKSFSGDVMLALYSLHFFAPIKKRKANQRQSP